MQCKKIKIGEEYVATNRNYMDADKAYQTETVKVIDTDTGDRALEEARAEDQEALDRQDAEWQELHDKLAAGTPEERRRAAGMRKPSLGRVYRGHAGRIHDHLRIGKLVEVEVVATRYASKEDLVGKRKHVPAKFLLRTTADEAARLERREAAVAEAKERQARAAELKEEGDAKVARAREVLEAAGIKAYDMPNGLLLTSENAAALAALLEG